MPREITFTKKDVIQAAFELVQEHGLETLSARRVAEHLGSSTTPVYSCFASMQELEMAVIKKIRDLMIAYTEKPYTDRSDLNMGIGVVLFARDNPKFFSTLFLEGNQFKQVTDEIFESCDKRLKQDPEYDRMSDTERKRLLHKLEIFSHGLASRACVGLLEKDSDEDIIFILWEMGRAFIHDAFMNIKGRAGSLQKHRHPHDGFGVVDFKTWKKKHYKHKKNNKIEGGKNGDR